MGVWTFFTYLDWADKVDTMFYSNDYRLMNDLLLPILLVDIF